MVVNYNDVFHARAFQSGVSVSDSFYYYLSASLLGINVSELKKNVDIYDRIEKFADALKKTPALLKVTIKLLIKDGFFELNHFRYMYNNRFYNQRGEENHLSIVKFVIIDNKLYFYDLTTSKENQKLLEVKQINNRDVSEIISIFRQDGYSDKEIASLIQHKEILGAYGIDGTQYNIQVLNDGELINIQLDDPDIRFDFSIFYKEHTKSKLLDKSHFDLSIGAQGKGLSYGSDSNLKLLSLLHGLSSSADDLALFKSLYDSNTQLLGNESSHDTYLDWMFISSFFLLNQEEKNILPDYLYLGLGRKLKLFDKTGPMCIFLDERNNELSHAGNVNASNCGCNASVFHDDQLDFKMIFHAIRNSLAHSSYEIIDDNYIRVYYYEETMKHNFKIHKNIVVDFINELSNYNNLGYIFPICSLEEPNSSNKPIETREELKKYLLNIEVSDLSNIVDHMQEEYDYYELIRNMQFFLSNSITRDAKDIAAETKHCLHRFMDYKLTQIKLTEEQIDKVMKQIDLIADTFYGQGASNQHMIITEIIRSNLNPSRNVSMIIEDIVNTRNKTNGTIMDMLNRDSTKYIDKEKVIKATIIAYLNNILLYNYNEKHVDASGIVFTDTSVDLRKVITSKEKRIYDLRHENKNLSEDINKIKKRISDIDKKLQHLKKTDESEKDILISERDALNNQLSQIDLDVIKQLRERNNLEIQLIKEEIEDLKVDKVDSSYILEHLRNSLAHGNIFFLDVIDLNNIGELEMTFIDYYPHTNIESFRCVIKLRNLLTTLNNDKFINSIFSNDVSFSRGD